ncbi:LysR family transcriptional regulator [Bosea sp. 685]|uniref:LysR family transcriptional regulator n=1 Tax=Bosea sp. 685 TaxID=3080057 RepID=UPI0028931A5A|nr:LysR substrate-binding domain-containing protein [Bosea sp. 685]WNJ93548.1 LysR substrate-binding domain-containing protein [Bosea sp. 685]
MDLRQIELLSAILETGSFSKAGESLRISQPAVSKAVFQLERELGLKLFERRPGRSAPTPEAQMLYQASRQVTVGLSELRRFAVDLKQNRGGHVSVAAFPAVSVFVLPSILAKFQMARDNARVSFATMHSREVYDAVATGRADIGLTVMDVDDNRVEKIERFAIPQLCILPIGHRLAKHAAIKAADLAGEPLISLSQDFTARSQFEAAIQVDKPRLQVVAETNHSNGVCAMVAAGAGCAMIDAISAQGWIGRVEIRPLYPPIQTQEFLIQPKDRPISQLASLLAVEITSSFRAFLTASMQHSPS